MSKKILWSPLNESKLKWKLSKYTYKGFLSDTRLTAELVWFNWVSSGPCQLYGEQKMLKGHVSNVVVDVGHETCIGKPYIDIDERHETCIGKPYIDIDERHDCIET